MSLPITMRAFLLQGFGGFDKLHFEKAYPRPEVLDDEVLLKVEACGINNTDIWTRQGAYAGSLDEASQSGWRGGSFTFPRIQGADIVGEVVALGKNVTRQVLNQRVMVNPTLYDDEADSALYKASIIGSERDGGFAEYVSLPADAVLVVNSSLSSAELATFMVSYLTAEHMLNRAGLTAGEHILVTGASGGVGSALIQLAKRRNAIVSCIIGAGKQDFARQLGADYIYTRGEPLTIDNESIHLIADVVGGEQVSDLLDSLVFGGRLVTAGAIAGPLVTLDWRKVYLKHLSLFGATMGTAEEARDLVGYIERGEIKPLLYASYPLEQLVEAQQAFLEKKFLGKLVITLS